jgi:hypothetical protein
MDWNRAIDAYCERTEPSFWAEPVNALTNAAFLVAAVAGWRLWRARGGTDRPVLVLVGLVGLIGVGSFLFHTFATRWAALADVVPIQLFILSYLVLALRRFLCIRPAWALLAAGGFLLASMGFVRAVAAAFGPGALNGSYAYLPAFAALVLVGLAARRRAGGAQAGAALLLAAGVFSLSLAFRTIDEAVCPAFPPGTHFLWHVLNALTLWLLLRAAILAAAPARPLSA